MYAMGTGCRRVAWRVYDQYSARRDLAAAVSGIGGLPTTTTETNRVLQLLIMVGMML